MLGPVSRRVVGCTCLFLPPRRRPSPNPADGSASRIDPLRDFTAAGISRSSPFLTFRPPGLFATQVSPTAAAPEPQGSRDFYARAEHAPLPLRASGMLAVRTRQLTAEDFHLTRLAALSAAPRTRTCDQRIMSPLVEFSVTGFCEMSLLFVSVESVEVRVFRARCHSLDTRAP